MCLHSTHVDGQDEHLGLGNHWHGNLPSRSLIVLRPERLRAAQPKSMQAESMIATGGKQVYGAPVGILMLDAQFPRISGDMGNATTWPFPVLYRIVRDASPDLIVRQGAPDMLEPFIEAGRELIRQGAEAITTNCGFLALFQAEMAQALGVPVATSSLMQVPMVQAMLPAGKRVAILTISKASLTPRHLLGAGCPTDIAVAGTEDGTEFTRAILGNELHLDVEASRQDLINAAKRLTQDHPDTGAIVLECTNMPPYQADIQAATGLPVFSIVDYVCWLQSGLRHRTY
ncbi:MAG: aspartate/glutamate racemase family protein [Pseudomonadota bacterium]